MTGCGKRGIAIRIADSVLGGIASYKWIPLTKGQWYMLLCVLNKLFVKE